MPDFDGDNLDFGDLKLPDIDVFEEHAEPANEADEVMSEPVKPEVEQTEEEKVAEPEPKKEQNNQSALIEWVGAVGVLLILLAIAWLGMLNFSTAIYLIAVAFVPFGIWKGRKTSTIFTVILGCTLIAVLTAVYFLWVEFGRYQFDVKARDGKHRIGMSQTIPVGVCSDQRNILHG